MAATSLIPKNGSVVYGTFVADYNAFDIDQSMNAEDVTPYGTNKCAKHVGSGTPSIAANITAYALAHTANTPAALDTAAATGANTIFTLDTGVTETFNLIQTSFKLSHGRMRGSVPYNISGVNGNDIVEVWATS